MQQEKLMEIKTEQRTVARGLNAMARKLGVSRSHLSLVVHGHRRPGAELARKLAKSGFVVAR